METKDHRDLARARHMLSRHFPRIPKDSAEEILEHGFLKGSGRVGRSMILDEEVKIELAVNAHIRHRFTNYDSLYSQIKADNATGDLKKTARTSVYDQVKKIAQSWREIGVPTSIMSSDVSKEMTGGLKGNKNGDDASHEQSDNQDQNLNSKLWPRYGLPPQRQAAMVAKLISFANCKQRKAIECPGHPAASDNDPIEPQREHGHVSPTHTLERALDHMNLDDETFGVKSRPDLKNTSIDPMIAATDTFRHTYQHHLQDVPSARSKGEGPVRPIIAEVYEEQAKEDLEILKRDFSHREHMTQRQIQEVVRLHKKRFQEDSQYAPVIELRGPEDETQRAARLAARRTDPRRSAKIALRKENRRKDTMEDLRRYKVGEELNLPKKRMNRLRRLLKNEHAEGEYASLGYRDPPEKHLRAFNAAENFATVPLTNSKEETIMLPTQSRSDASSMLVVPSSTTPNEEDIAECEGSDSELEWMDIS